MFGNVGGTFNLDQWTDDLGLLRHGRTTVRINGYKRQTNERK
jgi:hypothetical protein